MYSIFLIQDKKESLNNIKSLSNKKKIFKHTILIKYNFKKDNFIQKKNEYNIFKKYFLSHFNIVNIY